MDSKRQQKFSRLLQKELGEIFQKEAKDLFEKTFITITQVNVSPDLGVAKIYLSFLLAKNKQELYEAIQEQTKTLRQMLVHRIGKQVRVMPELHFFMDDTAEYADKMNTLLNDLDIPPADKNYHIEE